VLIWQALLVKLRGKTIGHNFLASCRWSERRPELAVGQPLSYIDVSRDKNKTKKGEVQKCGTKK
jgi:hypothetical protein